MAGYLGNIPTAVPLTSADIADGIITSAKITNGTIAIADLSATGTADATTFLRGDNSFATVSSDYVLLASTSASNVATLDLNGYFSSTYKVYKILIEGMYGSTDSVNFLLRFATTGSYTVQTGSSYSSISVFGNLTSGGAESASTTTGGFSADNIFLTHNSNNSSYRTNCEITIFNPSQSSYYHGLMSYNQMWNGTGSIRTSTTAGCWRDTTAVTGVRFLLSSGNLYIENVKLYGIK